MPKIHSLSLGWNVSFKLPVQ